MDLYEHQARELFKEHGIVVPRAEVTDSPERAWEIARALGGRAVVKAQVKTGGRGKAGGGGSPPTWPRPRRRRGTSSAWTSGDTRSTPSCWPNPAR